MAPSSRLLSTLLLALTGSSLSSNMVGGTSAMDISDERLQSAVHAVVPQFQAMAQGQGRNGMVSQLKIVEAQAQVVAGINYFVKVRRFPRDKI